MDRVHHGLLLRGVDGGGDLQSTGVHRLLRDAVRGELREDLRLDQAVRTLGDRTLVDGRRVDGLRVDRRRPLVAVDAVQTDEPVHHVVPPVLGLGTVGPRVKLAGPLDGRGEHRALLDGELLDGLVEVGLRRGTDAVGVTSEVDGVEVGLEDLVLGPLTRHLRGDDQLLALPDQGPLVTDHGVLHVLLGDGGTATGRVVAGELTDRRTPEAGDRETAVRVEVTVLGGEHGITHVLGHLVDVDVLAVALRGHDAGELRGAVRRVDVRDLVVLELFRLRNLRHRVGGEEGDERHDDEDRDNRADGRDDPPPPRTATPCPDAEIVSRVTRRRRRAVHVLVRTVVVSHLAGLPVDGRARRRTLWGTPRTRILAELSRQLPGTRPPGGDGSTRTAGRPPPCGR